MKWLILPTILISLCFPSCGSAPAKLSPSYKGVDPKAKSIYDEFMKLSSENNIVFYNKVTIGFKKLEGTTVGQCSYGMTWREIDLDPDYWNNSSGFTRISLLFHELAHCFCTRFHDYGPGKENRYPEKLEERVNQALKWVKNGGTRPGYWNDGCPVSFMYPTVIDDDCFLRHYSEYTVELFNRCNAW